MYRTKFDITIAYEKYTIYKDGVREMDDIKYDNFSFTVDENKKSYFNPQSMFVSKDAKEAIKAFVKTVSEKYQYLGFEPSDDCEIVFIDGSGDDTNI
jgi:hypothetical protein